ARRGRFRSCAGGAGTGRGWSSSISEAISIRQISEKVEIVKMRREEVRAYLKRPWDLLVKARHDHWARENRRSPGATVRASVALWEEMRRLHPDWPTPLDRQIDLEHHMRLRKLLDRAAQKKSAR